MVEIELTDEDEREYRKLKASVSRISELCLKHITVIASPSSPSGFRYFYTTEDKKTLHSAIVGEMMDYFTKSLLKIAQENEPKEPKEEQKTEITETEVEQR